MVVISLTALVWWGWFADVASGGQGPSCGSVARPRHLYLRVEEGYEAWEATCGDQRGQRQTVATLGSVLVVGAIGGTTAARWRRSTGEEPVSRAEVGAHS